MPKGISKIYKSENQALRDARSRCRNKNHLWYPEYGGRGIQVCERWNVFKNFLDDMGPKPTPKHTLDRINNDGHYEPSNCRWATQKEQNKNKRDNPKITYQGETMTRVDWAEKYNLNIVTLQVRLWRGWTFERAINTRPTR